MKLRDTVWVMVSRQKKVFSASVCCLFQTLIDAHARGAYPNSDRAIPSKENTAKVSYDALHCQAVEEGSSVSYPTISKEKGALADGLSVITKMSSCGSTKVSS